MIWVEQETHTNKQTKKMYEFVDECERLPFERALSPTPIKCGRWAPRSSEVAFDEDGNSFFCFWFLWLLFCPFHFHRSFRWQIFFTLFFVFLIFQFRLLTKQFFCQFLYFTLLHFTSVSKFHSNHSMRSLKWRHIKWRLCL